MKALENRIRARLETHMFCSAFESDLDRVWPYERKLRQQRIEAIENFAKRNGWVAKYRTREYA